MKKITFFLLSIFISTVGFGQYCTPTYANQCTSGDFINDFSLNTISNLGTGCASPSVSNYSDYTAMSTSLDQGITYNASFAPSASWGQYFVAWIDYNQDGDFDDVNEFIDLGYAGAGTTVVTPVTIPLGVSAGPTTMRVLCRFGTTPLLATDACNPALNYGECEDYSVVIGAPSANDAATNSIDSPMTGCGLGMETVMATYQNNGGLPIDTLVVCYNVNNGAWMCDTVTGLGLVPTATYQHTFTDLVDLSTTGDYTFNASVSLIGDSTPVNDTLMGYFIQSIPTITGLPYSENFESGTGGWTSSGTASNWEHGTPSEANIFGNGGCGTDSLAWATGLTTPYNANTVAYLESPCIDFSSLLTDPTLTFDHIFQVENTFESYFVEVSIDGGGAWTLLGAAGTGMNWYNQAGNWDGTSFTQAGQWNTAGHVLTGTAGESDVRIRFVLTSDGSVQQEGIAVDNINIDANVQLVDALPTSLAAPMGGCGLTSTELVMANYSNNGADTLFTFDVCYSVNGGATVCETVNDTILPGGTYMHTFATTADLSSVGQYMIDLIISSSDLNGCNDTMTFSLQNKPVINTFPYLETFENGPGGWEANNGANGTWELSTPAGAVINSAASGVNSWVTNATGNYNVNDNSNVEGPCFDFTTLPSGSWVAMKVWWESENSWDGANLQYSLDTAQTWTNLGAFGEPNNWYNDNTINSAPGGSQEGWTGDVNNNESGEWVIAKHQLADSTFLGQAHVLIRVNFGSDGSVTGEGFAFDNFAIGVPPTVNIGADYVGCANYEIDPGLPGTYEWFTEDTSLFVSTLISTDPVGVFPNTSFNDTTYNAILVYTDSLGLCGSDTAMVTLYPAPYNTLNDTTICYNDTVLYSVDAQSFYTYDWNNGSVVDSASYAYTSGGLVQVIVTNTNSGCSDSTTAMIYQTAAVSLMDIAFCAGDSVLVDATNVYDTYSWSTGDSLSTIFVSTAGTYTVTTEDNIGCMSTDSTVVTENALPTPTITSSADSICVDYDVTLNGGTGFNTYVWSTGGSAQSEVVAGSSLALGANTINLTVEDANGCYGMTTTSVFVDACAGIEELAINFNLYPNPSNGVFNYEFDGLALGSKMTLTDVLGKVIMTKEISSLTGEIDLSTYGNGTYLLNIQQNEASKTIRLVKQ